MEPIKYDYTLIILYIVIVIIIITNYYVSKYFDFNLKKQTKNQWRNIKYIK